MGKSRRKIVSLNKSKVLLDFLLINPESNKRAIDYLLFANSILYSSKTFLTKHFIYRYSLSAAINLGATREQQSGNAESCGSSPHR